MVHAMESAANVPVRLVALARPSAAVYAAIVLGKCSNDVNEKENGGVRSLVVRLVRLASGRDLVTQVRRHLEVETVNDYVETAEKIYESVPVFYEPDRSPTASGSLKAKRVSPLGNEISIFPFHKDLGNDLIGPMDVSLNANDDAMKTGLWVIWTLNLTNTKV